MAALLTAEAEEQRGPGRRRRLPDSDRAIALVDLEDDKQAAEQLWAVKAGQTEVATRWGGVQLQPTKQRNLHTPPSSLAADRSGGWMVEERHAASAAASARLEAERLQVITRPARRIVSTRLMASSPRGRCDRARDVFTITGLCFLCRR